jgi:hypothetical protein
VQAPDAGHVSAQFPAEQSMVHGAEVHDDSQLPAEQLQVPPGHDAACRGAPVPGSATIGPPFGEVPPPGVLLDPPHAITSRTEKPKPATYLCMRQLLPMQKGERPILSSDGMMPNAMHAGTPIPALPSGPVRRAPS